MRFFEWYQHQWPWSTLNDVMIAADARYLYVTRSWASCLQCKKVTECKPICIVELLCFKQAGSLQNAATYHYQDDSAQTGKFIWATPTFVDDQPTGQTPGRNFTHNNSEDAESGKGKIHNSGRLGVNASKNFRCKLPLLNAAYIETGFHCPTKNEV